MSSFPIVDNNQFIILLPSSNLIFYLDQLCKIDDKSIMCSRPDQLLCRPKKIVCASQEIDNADSYTGILSNCETISSLVCGTETYVLSSTMCRIAEVRFIIRTSL